MEKPHLIRQVALAAGLFLANPEQPATAQETPVHEMNKSQTEIENQEAQIKEMMEQEMDRIKQIALAYKREIDDHVMAVTGDVIIDGQSNLDKFASSDVYYYNDGKNPPYVTDPMRHKGQAFIVLLEQSGGNLDRKFTISKDPNGAIELTLREIILSFLSNLPEPDNESEWILMLINEVAKHPEFKLAKIKIKGTSEDVDIEQYKKFVRAEWEDGKQFLMGGRDKKADTTCYGLHPAEALLSSADQKEREEILADLTKILKLQLDKFEKLQTYEDRLWFLYKVGHILDVYGKYKIKPEDRSLFLEAINKTLMASAFMEQRFSELYFKPDKSPEEKEELKDNHRWNKLIGFPVKSHLFSGLSKVGGQLWPKKLN